jgi:hypothetical protein
MMTTRSATAKTTKTDAQIRAEIVSFGRELGKPRATGTAAALPVATATETKAKAGRKARTARPEAKPAAVVVTHGETTATPTRSYVPAPRLTDAEAMDIERRAEEYKARLDATANETAWRDDRPAVRRTFVDLAKGPALPDDHAGQHRSEPIEATDFRLESDSLVVTIQSPKGEFRTFRTKVITSGSLAGSRVIERMNPVTRRPNEPGPTWLYESFAFVNDRNTVKVWTRFQRDRSQTSKPTASEVHAMMLSNPGVWAAKGYRFFVSGLV